MLCKDTKKGSNHDRPVTQHANFAFLGLALGLTPRPCGARPSSRCHQGDRHDDCLMAQVITVNTAVQPTMLIASGYKCCGTLCNLIGVATRAPCRVTCVSSPAGTPVWASG